MRDRVSLSHVARTAGVSTATASRALSDAYGVAPATRRRVVEAAAQLDYSVSPEASRLAMRRRSRSAARRIAVVTPASESTWWTGASAAHRALSEAGHDVVLLPVDGEDSRQRVLERVVRDRAVDAAILAGVRLDRAERQRLELAGLVVVAVGYDTDPHDTDGGTDVRVAESECRLVAVEHLVALGHRRIACVRVARPDPPSADPPSADPPSTDAPDKGTTVARSGVAVVSVDVCATSEGVRSAIEALLGDAEPPTALWVESLELAVAALTWLRHGGRCVPSDISVVGQGEHVLAEMADLTTVSVRSADVGTSAAALLLAMMRGDQPGYILRLPPRLVKRGSAGPPQPERVSSPGEQSATLMQSRR